MKKGPKAFYNIEFINVSLKNTQYWKFCHFNILLPKKKERKKIIDSYGLKELLSSSNATFCFLEMNASWILIALEKLLPLFQKAAFRDMTMKTMNPMIEQVTFNKFS